MEPPPPGPCSSPPGPRPVPPPRKGSMERRPHREPSEVRGPGGQPGTPERATVTQTVLIVMEGRSVTSEETNLGGQRAPPLQSMDTEKTGPPPPGNTTDLGPLLPQGPPPPGYNTDPGPRYTVTESQGPILPQGPPPPRDNTDPGPRYTVTKSQGPPPPGNNTDSDSQGPPPPPGKTTDPGPPPPRYIASESMGHLPPGNITATPNLGPLLPQYTVTENQGPLPHQYTVTESQGPLQPGSYSATLDPGPLPHQYILSESQGHLPPGNTTDLGPPPPRYIASESQGHLPPGNIIATPNLGPLLPQYSVTESQGPLPHQYTVTESQGPLPHQYILSESHGHLPPRSTTVVQEAGPPPLQYSITESQGPLPPGSTTGGPELGPPPAGSITTVQDPGPLPPQYTMPESKGPPAPVPNLRPVSPQYTAPESQGPPRAGAATGVPDSGPIPPLYTTSECRAMVTVSTPPHDELIPPPRDSPRKAPVIRPVWVMPRKVPENLGGPPTQGPASPPTQSNTGRGVALIQTSGEVPIEHMAAQRVPPPQDSPAHLVPSQGQRTSELPIKGPQETSQDGRQWAQGAVASLLNKRSEEVIAAPRVMSDPDTAAEKMGPPPPVTQGPTSAEAPAHGGQIEPSVPPGTTSAGPQNSSIPPEGALPDGSSQSSAAPPPGSVIGPPASSTLPQQQDTSEKKALPGQNSTPPTGPPSTQLGTSLSPHRSVSSKPPLPIPPRSSLYPGHAPSIREQEPSLSLDTASLSSFRSKAPAPDTLSYLDSVSLMSGTMESLSHLDDASSLGSDSEINGMPYRRTDKYGFLGGNQFSGNGESNLSVEIARQRELKWLDMFNHWDKWLIRRFQKVKLRCRKGIPSSLRARAWQYLSNSHYLLSKNPGKFEELERHPGDPKWLDVIEKDLHRQFPFHEMFAARGGHGQQDLYRILKAYTVYRPEEGYCQAQAPVAAVLLMHMPAEQAFWCLVQICDKYLPGYYSAGLEAIQLDGEIFFALLRRVCPMAYRHLKKFKIDPILYMTEWFMCIFSRTLPWSSVLRVWDMFFCEGVKIVFRVGLVLLRHTLGSVDKLRSCQGMYETMEKLRSLPPHCMQEEVLLPEVSALAVTDALIERESNTQLRKWRENRGELQYRPSRRLHGARQIQEEKLRLNPSLSGSRLSLSSLSSFRRPSPPASPALVLQPPESVVVSEGLHPVLPSPTANKAPLGPPKEAAKKGKEKQKEQDKKREREEREREKKREKEEREERERERKREKEREKLKEKEEKRLQKEKEKAEAKQKKERKVSFRRKESSSPATDSTHKGATGSADDTYF
ncbi:TBC1 domain family member 10B-like isoform X3 [Rana temporaria]|uniref:TBC1 domain family member 10B-like isoform X3 n=1 Tax=Rana temporaria TaxID=8407 RepID=UPI001AAD8C30|nr:TBC1 domain family member 10B-like isoform X3 [Rana temporaria]